MAHVIGCNIAREQLFNELGCTGGATLFICVSAWNKDPVFGVIGVQSGPPH